jgi:WhiB family redox-sensing transcriptional regulator
MIGAGLLDALGGMPALPGARCVGHHALFDPAHQGEGPAAEDRHRQALRLCAACPALDACHEWMRSLPARQRPDGVIAGTIGGQELV